MQKVRPIIWGIAIAALGIIFGGNAIGLFNFNVFFDGWWTLFIIIPSFISLITEKRRLTSLALLITGILLLLAAQNVFSYDVAWKAILATILTLIGITIIFKSIFHSKNDNEIEKKVKDSENDKDMDAQMAVFSSNEKTYRNETFSGANLLAVFGGVELDLREAIFKKDTVIKACSAFGGIEIKVPADVQIKSKSAIFFGGITDERKYKDEKSKYTIYLDAAGGFGGVTISDEEGKAKKA